MAPHNDFKRLSFAGSRQGFPRRYDMTQSDGWRHPLLRLFASPLDNDMTNPAKGNADTFL